MKVDAAVSRTLNPAVVAAPVFRFAPGNFHNQGAVLILPDWPEILEHVTICIGTEATP